MIGCADADVDADDAGVAVAVDAAVVDAIVVLDFANADVEAGAVAAVARAGAIARASRVVRDNPLTRAS